MTRAQVLQAVRFAGGIYSQRAWFLWWGLGRRDLLSRLNLPGGRADPYAIYEEMRARGPMLATPLGNWSSTSHPVCNEVLRSRAFAVVPEDSPDLGLREFLNLSILQLNPPDHSRIRRLAAPAFTPRRMAGYTTLVDEALHRLLDTAEAQGEFDLMTAFASPLPIAVITRLLGFPDDDLANLRRLGSTIAQALDGVWSLRQARVLAAAEKELRQVFADLLELRTREPGEDLTSALVAEQGNAITADELGPLVRLLLIAGFETTVNAIGNGMRWLLANPEQWQLLVDDPSRAPAVVEEVLRYDPPVQQTARVALRDVDVAGTPVRRNQWVITLLAAANRDPDVFAEPGRFDITRMAAVEHLAFSGGIHYCLGSPLARLELTEAFRALAERFPHLHATGPVVMRPATTLRGPARFPVSVRARADGTHGRRVRAVS